MNKSVLQLYICISWRYLFLHLYMCECVRVFVSANVFLYRCYAVTFQTHLHVLQTIRDLGYSQYNLHQDFQLEYREDTNLRKHSMPNKALDK